jgi:glucose/arabinose dehydrogenase
MTPVAAAGLAVDAYAAGLDHPRWLYVLPNGDVLVAESNGPPRPDDAGGIKGWVMKLLRQRAGGGIPSANRITLLRDANGDGVAETRTVFLAGLNSPFGMTLVGSDLYVANTDSVMRFPYKAGDTQITAPGVKIVDLPAGTINHHWTKNIIASRDGSRLYVTVGSNSNVGENGMENEINRAAILEVDPGTGRSRLFASGLRNPNGMDWQPQSGALWTAVNERDELGSDLVPDFMTSVQDGAFYGWPYSYYGQHVDPRVKPERPDLVARAIAPDYALGTHTASLGLVFYRGNLLSQRYVGGAFIGQHGSGNRTRECPVVPVRPSWMIFPRTMVMQADVASPASSTRSGQRSPPRGPQLVGLVSLSCLHCVRLVNVLRHAPNAPAVQTANRLGNYAW